MNSSKSPAVGWLFQIVGIVLIIINAALTFQFGSQYFAAAFSVGIMGEYLAGFYGLLIMDIAYITWFAVFLRGSTGKKQRQLAGLMAAISLMGSVLATVNQLIVNSFGLGDFAQYQDSIGTASLITMIVLTAAHIIAFAAFVLFDPNEQIKTQGANTLSDVIEDALAEVKLRLNSDKDVLIDHISAGYRVEMLTALGFTSDLKQVGKALPDGNPPTQNDTQPVKRQQVNPDHTRENLPDGSMPITYANGAAGANGVDFLATNGKGA